MTREQYLDTLKRLGLTPYGQRTAEALGLTVEHIGRYARGEKPVSKRTELMLKLLEKMEERK